MKDSLLQNRRQFFSNRLKGVGLLTASHYVPAFLTRTAQAMGRKPTRKSSWCYSSLAAMTA